MFNLEFKKGDVLYNTKGQRGTVKGLMYEFDLITPTKIYIDFDKGGEWYEVQNLYGSGIRRVRPKNKKLEYIVEPWENAEIYEKVNEIIGWINEHERKGD